MDMEVVRILSRWAWHADAGLVKQQETDEEDYQEIDGTLIGPGGFAVSDDGAVISASKLTVPQLKAELTARALPIEGKRADLYRRVQVGTSLWGSGWCHVLIWLQQAILTILRLSLEHSLHRETHMRASLEIHQCSWRQHACNTEGFK